MSEPPPKKPRVAVIAAFLAVCLGALGTEVLTIRYFLKALQVKSWPTTKGIVTRSELGETYSSTPNYTAHIEYEYALNGKSFKSSSVRTRGTGSKHKSEAITVVNAYPLNAEVSVFYDPQNPAETFLEAGVDVVNYVIIIVPLVFAFMMGVLFYDQFQQWRNFDKKPVSPIQ